MRLASGAGQPGLNAEGFKVPEGAFDFQALGLGH